jgi:competence protein ComFC
MKKTSVKGSFTGLVFNTVTKKLMYQFKYRPYLSGLSSFLGDLLYESLVQKEGFIKALESKPILVPIPLYSSKLKKRGYNQSELLARELAKRFDLEVVDCLERIKVTKSQVGLTKKERKENVRGAFEIKQNHVSQLMKKNIFMVDDVLTTGSTFSEACLVLKKNGAGTIWAIAFAKED